MNNTKWENQTYQELIEDCLGKLDTPLTWEEFTTKLNINNCYSFGFKHPNFHRFYEGGSKPVYKVWFIQTVDLDEESNTYLWASDTSPVGSIPNQSRYLEPVGSLKELYKIASSSLEDFALHVNEETLTPYEPCYGFILRSVNFEITKYHSDLFIESSLMRAIRRTWYENSIVDLCHTNGWQKYKETVITLNSYLDTESYETFRILFPQYQQICDEYNLEISRVIKLMIDPNVFDNPQSEDANLPVVLIDESRLKLYKTIANNVLTSFTKSVKYSINTKSPEQKRKIFFEYILDTSMLVVLMPLFVDV